VKWNFYELFGAQKDDGIVAIVVVHL
jgi:hypothetical protein